MTDYIKREDAKDAVINIVGWEKIAKYVDELSKHPSTKDIDYYDALIDAEDVIDDLPSADVAPVRHGRWIGTEYDGYANGFPVYDVYECSECGMEYDSTDDGEITHNYCPNCGAKMDEEKDDAVD